MLSNCSAFDAEKASALKVLFQVMERGLVDPDIIPLLSALNSRPNYYTTSSCSGRIQLAVTELPGGKFRMLVLAKWHRPIEARELQAILPSTEHCNLWLAVQGPIIHVACRDLPSSLLLLSASRRAGLKHSGVLWVGAKRVVVELVASDRMDVPLRLSGLDIIPSESLELLVERANRVLERGKARLSKLLAEVEKLSGKVCTA